MREGKYVEELNRLVQQIPDEAGLDADEFVQVASIVARQHPVWYERFFWRDKCVKAWRRLMGDFQNMQRARKETRRLNRQNRREQFIVSLWLTVAGLTAGAAILVVALWLTNKL